MLSKRHMSTSARETVVLWNDRTYIAGPAPIFIYRATLPGRPRILASLLTINKILRFSLPQLLLYVILVLIFRTSMVKPSHARAEKSRCLIAGALEVILHAIYGARS